MKYSLPFPNSLGTFCDLQFIDVYAFYDRALLFSVYDSLGEIYLINLFKKDSEKQIESWIVSNISRENLDNIRAGTLDFRNAFLTSYSDQLFIIHIDWHEQSTKFSSVKKNSFDLSFLPVSGECLDEEEITELGAIPNIPLFSSNISRNINISFNNQIYEIVNATLVFTEGKNGSLYAVLSNSSKIFIEEEISRNSDVSSIYFDSLIYQNADLIYSFGGRRSSFGIADLKTLDQTTTALSESYRIAAAGVAEHYKINPILLSSPIIQDIQHGSIKYLVTANASESLALNIQDKDINFTVLDLMYRTVEWTKGNRNALDGEYTSDVKLMDSLLRSCDELVPKENSGYFFVSLNSNSLAIGYDSREPKILTMELGEAIRAERERINNNNLTHRLIIFVGIVDQIKFDRRTGAGKIHLTDLATIPEEWGSSVATLEIAGDQLKMFLEGFADMSVKVTARQPFYRGRWAKRNIIVTDVLNLQPVKR